MFENCQLKILQLRRINRYTINRYEIKKKNFDDFPKKSPIPGDLKKYSTSLRFFGRCFVTIYGTRLYLTRKFFKSLRLFENISVTIWWEGHCKIIMI